MAHGAVKYLVRVLEAAFLVILLGVGVLAWRLSQGPVAINILSPYVTGALEVFNPGFQFQIEHAEFRWTGFEGQPQLVVRDVRVLDPKGSVIAGLPNLVAFLSVPALLNGDFSPERINLLNPIIRFVHRADGTFSLGTESTALAGAPETTSGNALFAGLVGSLTSPPSAGGAGSYLKSISIEGTTLTLVDEESGRRWLTPDAALRFARNDGGVQFTATLPISEEGRFWDVNVTGAYIQDTGNLAVDFNIENFRPARIADLAPQLSVLEMADLGLTGIIAANFALEGNSARIERVDFDVEGSAGQFVQAQSQVNYPIRNASLRGYATASLNRIVVEDFRMTLGGDDELDSIVTLSVVADELNQKPNVRVEAFVDAVSVEALKRYWPVGVAPNTRDWVVKNLSGGMLSDLTTNIHLAGPNFGLLDATHLSLSSDLAGFSVVYIDGLPEIRDVDGNMQIAIDEAIFNITSGNVPDTFSIDNLNVRGATLRMRNLGQRGTETADFDIDIEGDFGAAMRLIDYQPFGYATAMGVDANAAQGKATIKLGLKFPLVKDLKLDQLDIQVDALVEGVSIPDVAFQLPLSEGQMSVSLDRGGMDVNGSARLGDIPLTIEWRENFVGDEIRSHYVLNPLVENQDRPAIGLGVAPFVPPYIDGPVEAQVTYIVNRDSSAFMNANVDLTDPALSIPELNWSKDSGVSAHAKVSALFFDGQLKEVSSFQVESEESLNISGRAKFGRESNLESLVLEPSHIGESRLSGEIQATAKGDYNVTLAGAILDGRSLLNEIEFGGGVAEENEAARSEDRSLALRAQFDQVRLAPEVTFSDVAAQFQSDSGGVKLIDFVSKVDTDTPFEFNLSDGPDGRVFFGGSANGGSVVRAAGLFDDIEGGLLKISGTVNENGVATGLAEIDDFKLVDAPIIARLLSVAALTGILDELRGDGISFTKLRVPFSLANSSLSIEDGEMYGSSLGLTGEGYYDFENATMNFDGTLIPAYALNSALNSIPILGDVLNAGDKGGGIFAATYSYRGDVATVEPTVNPLAALTPGFLRRIFDIFEPNDERESIESDDAANPSSPEHQEDIARP